MSEKEYQKEGNGGFQVNRVVDRGGKLREPYKHARGRNLADWERICGSPPKSVGSIEEMFEMINNVDCHS